MTCDTETEYDTITADDMPCENCGEIGAKHIMLRDNLWTCPTVDDIHD